ncbi:serine protease [Rheinheimera mesophila]|uniref:Serine protease n=1 Tax=Rheinheimera mesophila TaxID=1547515 RepID=A0A3P3QSW4_9GAMM|nr:S8 family serine peptidase [Rheinheimera mesophila]KKL03219.1 serine protease [Rheinheimera mesophila]RRJ23510.1 serine protease [Rheinheimera mesophila]
MSKLKYSALSVAVLVALAACGGDGNKNIAPQATNVSLTNIEVREWVPVSGAFAGTDANQDALTLTTISENGTAVTPTGGVYTLSKGTLAVTGLNFVFTPMAPGEQVFSYTVSDGSESATATVTIASAGTDPLAYQQWHLKNTGQKAFSMSDSLYETYFTLLTDLLGLSEEDAAAVVESRKNPDVLVAGEDMNVTAAYAAGSTGSNTVAVVVDSGLEIAHEDLQGNVIPNRSLNFIPGAADPTNPTNNSAFGDHGTSVAGLIAAQGWNGLGGRGVAPDAQLIGMNYLEEQSNVAFVLSHGGPGSGITASEPVAVFNRSYGLTVPAAIAYSEFEEAVQQFSATELRSGKGAVNMKSSGNSFLDGSTSFDNDLCAVNGANDLGLTCYNGNFEPSQATPYYFSVGAVNSDGKHTSYSTAGANLLVSAPAGEYGTFEPAMVTTDQMTCLRGYSSFASAEDYDGFYFPGFFEGFFPFNNPGHPENASCNYTSTFNGTSSAAPNASGVVALIASANPELSYRDIRHILVSTSTMVDAENAPVSLELANGEFVAHQGWVENAAGYNFNNLYGFGRVDAGAAVAMAKNYTVNLGEEVSSDWVGVGSYAATETPASLALPVPDNSVTGATVTLEVADDIVLEGAQLKFSISNPEMEYGFNTVDGYFQTTAGIDLAIEVTSPSGTKSVLLSSKQALTIPALTEDFFFQPGYILNDTVFLTNAFYGENAQGTWTIKVLDANGSDYAATGGYLEVDGYVNNTEPSVVEGVAIRVFGH